MFNLEYHLDHLSRVAGTSDHRESRHNALQEMALYLDKKNAHFITPTLVMINALAATYERDEPRHIACANLQKIAEINFGAIEKAALGLESHIESERDVVARDQLVNAQDYLHDTFPESVRRPTRREKVARSLAKAIFR
ncbi:MAG: hypothetical protein FWF24_01745 [Alphaproteobacteria bacterium]|nr:hypothetical protein [Alphaproteobacteria bacterium]